MKNTSFLFLPLFISWMFLYSPFSALCQDTIVRDHRTSSKTDVRDHRTSGNTDVKVRKSVDVPIKSSVNIETKKDLNQENPKPFFETAPGFLTAIAALITAVVALIQVFKRRNIQ